METITGPISRIISREGMPGVYNSLDEAGKKEFEKVGLPLILSGPTFKGRVQFPVSPFMELQLYQWVCFVCGRPLCQSLPCACRTQSVSLCVPAAAARESNLRAGPLWQHH